MLNTFAFSIDRILESIYAFAALDSLTYKNQRPAVLGRDQEPALRRILRACASDLFMQLAPHIVRTDLDDSAATGTLEADFDIPDTPARELIRPAIETVLAAMVAATVWGNVNPTLSDVYSRIAASETERLRAVLPAGDKPGFIEPSI